MIDNVMNNDNVMNGKENGMLNVTMMSNGNVTNGMSNVTTNNGSIMNDNNIGNNGMLGNFVTTNNGHIGNGIMGNNVTMMHNGYVTRNGNVGDGMMNNPIGMIHGPNGTMNNPNGLTNGPNGTINNPNGMIHGPNGTMNNPNATIHGPYGMIHGPNGMIHGPNGMIHGPNGMIHGPNGMIHGPNGMIHGPNGMIHGPNGMVNGPNGMVHGPNGMIHGPNGMVHGPNGMLHGPNGMIHGPNGMIHGPNGMIHGPNGMIHGPNGMVHGPNGLMNNPNGSNNGILNNPNGMMNIPYGMIYGSNGMMYSSYFTMNNPSGMIFGPNGAIYDPTGLMNNPYGIIYGSNGMIYDPNSTMDNPNGMLMNNGNVMNGNEMTNLEFTNIRKLGLCGCCQDAGDKLCSQCKAVTYCSKNCQTKHWKLHKLTCKSVIPATIDTPTSLETSEEIDWIETLRLLQQCPRPSEELKDSLSSISSMFQDLRRSQFEYLIENGQDILRELIAVMDDDSAGGNARNLALKSLFHFVNPPSNDFHTAKRAATVLFDEKCDIIPRLVRVLYKEEAYIDQKKVLMLLKGSLESSSKIRLAVSNPESGIVQALIHTLKQYGSSSTTPLRSIAVDVLVVIRQLQTTGSNLRRVPNFLMDLADIINASTGHIRGRLVFFLYGILSSSIPVPADLLDIPVDILNSPAMLRALGTLVYPQSISPAFFPATYNYYNLRRAPPMSLNTTRIVRTRESGNAQANATTPRQPPSSLEDPR